MRASRADWVVLHSMRCSLGEVVMRRRQFISVVWSAAAAWPLGLRAQGFQVPARIGLLPLGLSTSVYDRSLVEAFRQGLRDAGLRENQHVILDLVWVEDDAAYPRVVADLVQRGLEPTLISITSL